MAIYGISDLHLSFGTDKPMNIFGKVWKNYEKRLEKNWIEIVDEKDTVIIPGDISWGMNLKEALKDFQYIDKLPGKKIILKGNHDYYFTTKTRMDNFFMENNITNFQILHISAIDIGEYILCGTRGWGKTENKNEEALEKKIFLREEGRLRMSLEDAKKMQNELREKGIKKDILVALHFPPFYGKFKEIMEEYNVNKCIYGHLHGYGHTFIKEGIIDGIEYEMVSCDYTEFKPIKI